MQRRVVYMLTTALLLAREEPLASAQTTSCCEQCKTGYVYKLGVNTRINCNIPGQTANSGWSDCPSECTTNLSPLRDYCMSCSDNYYMDFSRCTSACLACPAGKVGTGSPDDQCQRCSPGYRIEISACVKCVPGKYQNLYHQTSCQDCDQNYYSDTPGASACTMMRSCIAGQYMSRDGDSARDRECSSCPAGKYSEYRNIDTECSSCPPGKFQEFEAMTFCYDHRQCVPGSRLVSAGTSTKDYVCEDCVRPWTTIVGTQTVCSDCVAGKYKLGSSVTATCVDCNCANQGEVYTACPAGSNAKTCTPCTGTRAGAYCAAGYEPSAVCDGTQTQDTQCVMCPAGKHKPSATVRSCVSCPTAYYKPPPASAATCAACTNKPSDAEYLPWTGLDGSRIEPTTSQCPW